VPGSIEKGISAIRAEGGALVVVTDCADAPLVEIEHDHRLQNVVNLCCLNDRLISAWPLTGHAADVGDTVL